MKRLKIITTYIVLVAIVIGIIPAEIFANSQAPVNSGVVITSQPSTSGYSVSVDWTSPNAVRPANGGDVHPIERFDIEIQNTVTGEKEKTEEIVAQTNDYGGQKYTAEITRALKDGYLYRFAVFPKHTHTTTDADGNTTTVEAPVSNSGIIDNQAFFMTDLKVDGTGKGSTLTVQWDNPSELIKKYRITYKKISSDDPTNAPQGLVEVPTDDPDLTTFTDRDSGNQRYSYEITNESVISAANMYDVVVEPIFNNGTAQEGKKNISLTENGKNISVTVKDSGENTGKYPAVITTELPLDLQEIDEKNIKLTWTGLDAATIYAIDKLEILESLDDKFDKYTVLRTLHNEGARIGFYTLPKPKVKTWYKIVVTFKVGEDGKIRPPMNSEIVLFNPTMIPFTPNKPDILEVKTVLPDTGSSYQLDMTWSAFIRAPYTDVEKENTIDDEKKVYVDKDVKYDIWVSDDITGLYNNTIPPLLSDLTPDSVNNVTFKDKDNNDIIAYNTLLSQYTKKTDNGYQNIDLVPNTLYYIKIVVKKDFDEGQRVSEPEYLLVYFNEAGNIFTPPMLSKPPLKVRKDTSGKDMITQTEVTIEWKTKWSEILQNDKWIYTEQTVTDSTYRNIDLDDGVKYEVLVVPYKDIETFALDYYNDVVPPYREEIYDDYVRQVILSEETPSTSVFTTIENPTIDTDDKFKSTLYATLEGLNPNTEYVILFRAYRPLADVSLRSDPAYLTITTLPTDTIITETPTVPTLFLHEKDDMSITVKWKKEQFKYELSISEKLLNDPGTGTLIPSDEITEKSKTISNDTEIGKDALSYIINGLFPETGYYIWIRAISDSAPNPSAWSTPLYVVTDPLRKPDPPEGLGLVSDSSLKYINEADDTKYVARDKDYLIVEWMKDVNDISGAYNSAMTGDSGMLGAPDITKTMVAMFKNLIPNKPYWIKAATRVVIQKGGGNANIAKTFSYVIQVADNEDFTDAIEIEIPQAYVENTSGDFRMEISDFCTAIKINTKTSTDDYDTDVDPSLYPLPDQDFELIYDSATDTLTHRLRSNEIGQDGMPDNRVDQRVINKIISSGTYTYAIDVTTYNNRLVKNRIVEIPFTLLDTFRRRDINVQITADNLTLILKPEWLSTQQAQQAIGYGDSSKLRIIMNQDINMPLASTSNFTNSTGYLSSVQKLGLVMQTPQGTTNIAYTVQPMTIKLKAINRYDTYDKNIDAYIFDTASSEWQRADNVAYDSQTARYSFDTTKVSAYTVLGIEAPASSESSEAVKALSNKINIIDIRDYKASDPITANQLTNLIYSIAKNQKDVALNAVVTNSQAKELTRAGLSLTKVGDSSVSRQEAISSIVRLYELKTGFKIDAGDISTTSLSDMDSVSALYQQNILKAEQIGLLDSNMVRANEAITLDEVAQMINIVIDSIY